MVMLILMLLHTGLDTVWFCVTAPKADRLQQLKTGNAPEIPKGQISGRPANWRPTLTLAKAWKVFHRSDARIYVRITRSIDARGSETCQPIFLQTITRRLIADWDEASRQRQAAYDYLRGNVSTTAKAYLATSTVK